MRYLLVNHVPFGAGSAPGKYRVGDLFIQDLCAQARAIKAVGGELIAATPLVPNLSAMSGGSFDTVEADPAACGFAYVPLQRYQSLKQYLRVKRDLNRTLESAIDRADIVQMDYGGYPFMLGQVVWPIATRLNKKRIWLFDGADPFPRLELEAQNERNPFKRFAKRIATRRKIDFCRTAITQADLVFAHNAAVVERFKSIWGPQCHAFDRSFVTDEILIPDVAHWEGESPAEPGSPQHAARREPRAPVTMQDRARQLRDTSRPLRLICAGRQIRIKGTDQVIQTIAKLRDMNIPVEFNVMGDGDDLAVFKQLAADLNLTDRVHFTGTVPYGQPLFDVWATADIMLVTNLTAEISRNVLLSLARGLPLVTYENPGTDALLRDHDAAVIVPKGNIDALAKTIAELNLNRERLVQLAENGLKLARVKTLDATHRKRAELAAGLFRKSRR